MPLRDVEEYHRWIEHAVLSNQPEYEVREAVLDVEGEPSVLVWYRHLYAIEAVDVITVRNR